jgi:hypothetical protein
MFSLVAVTVSVRGQPVETPIRTETVTATRENIDQPSVQMYLYRGDCI